MSDFYNKYPYTDFHELNLDWIIERVKQLTTDWLETKEVWENTEADWQELYSYVHDYFNNLDVQDEINAKINSMIADGTFATIITPIVNNQVSISVSEWLESHITPTTPAIDDSLSVRGAAADAYVTGKLIEQAEASTGDGFVRFTNGYYIATNLNIGDTVDLTPVSGSSANNYAIIDISENDIINLTGTGGSAGRLWAFIDSSNKLLSVSAASASLTDNILTVPHGAVKLILNTANDAGICFIGGTLRDLIRTNVGAIKRAHGYYSGNLFDKKGCLSDTRMKKSDGSLEAYAGSHVSNYIPVEPFHDYHFNFSYDSTTYGMIFYDSDKSVIAGSGKMQALYSPMAVATPFSFYAPANAYYVRFTVPASAWSFAEMYEDYIDSDITNLIIEDYCTPNSRVNINNGNIESASGTSSSGLIRLEHGKLYDISFSYYSSTNYGMAFYDDEHAYVSGSKQAVALSSSETEHFRFIMPDNADYVRITIVDRYETKELKESTFEDNLYYTIPDNFKFTTVYTETQITTGVPYANCDVQGGCHHEGYLYYALRFNGDDSGDTMLRKFDLETSSVISTAYDHSYGHANSMTYNGANDTLLIMTSVYDATVAIVDPSDLSYVSEVSLQSIVDSVVTGETWHCSNIEYNANLNKIFLFVAESGDPFTINGITSRTVIVLDNNLDYEKHYKMPVITSYNTSDTTITDKFIINAQYDGTTVNNRLAYYDLNGHLIVNDIVFNAFNEPEFVIISDDAEMFAGFNEAAQPKIVKCDPTSNRFIPKVDALLRFNPF